MSMLDLQTLKDTPLTREPFEFVIVNNFIREQALADLMADFPDPGKPGSVPLPQVRGGAAFRQFVQDLEGPDFRAAVEEKFDIDLSGRPTMMTVRGQCRETDGKIHTDSKTKLITVLIYMNPPWDSEGGRLRLLPASPAAGGRQRRIEPGADQPRTARRRRRPRRCLPGAERPLPGNAGARRRRDHVRFGPRSAHLGEERPPPGAPRSPRQRRRGRARP